LYLQGLQLLARHCLRFVPDTILNSKFGHNLLSTPPPATPRGKDTQPFTCHCESHTAFGGDIAIESANIADLRSKMRHFLSRSEFPSDVAIWPVRSGLGALE
jgi:hypothetical protein